MSYDPVCGEWGQVTAPGIVTTHDDFAIAFTPAEMERNVETLLATHDEQDARNKFTLCTQSQWVYSEAMRELERVNWRAQITPIMYRPFDTRWTVFNRYVAVHRRERVMRHTSAAIRSARSGSKTGAAAPSATTTSSTTRRSSAPSPKPSD